MRLIGMSGPASRRTSILFVFLGLIKSALATRREKMTLVVEFYASSENSFCSIKCRIT